MRGDGLPKRGGWDSQFAAIAALSHCIGGEKSCKSRALGHFCRRGQRVEAVDIRPLQRDVATVAAIKTKAALARHMRKTDGRFGISLFARGLAPDTADASMNALSLGQARLGMPDRDYYLKAQFKPQ